MPSDLAPQMGPATLDDFPCGGFDGRADCGSVATLSCRRCGCHRCALHVHHGEFCPMCLFTNPEMFALPVLQ